ncbi:unnamed protein product [Blepharisma stoltei]|uniref:SPK domain-containing protein n=1 Tax=Blepharisma stoltei TaxID=1481888 RepID=A0AAU9KFS4_9CILI|nr:unnamed protein product [Blepharisma stoltei]
MDQNFTLFEINKRTFHSIFKKHLGHDKKLPVLEFQKFCKIARICPDLISIAELRAVLSRISNTISISKISFSFEDFEKALKEIAIISSKGSISERVRSFFLQIIPRCQAKYSVEFNISDKKDSQVVVKKIKRSADISRSSLNDSGSSMVLDLNIKEALETLKLSDSMRTTSLSPKSDTDKPGRKSRKLSFSSRSRSESGSPSQKFFMSPRQSLKPIKTFRLPIKTENKKEEAMLRSSKTLPSENKNPPDHVELDEFIQTEQSILNEVATVTVSLAKPKKRIKLDIDLRKVDEPISQLKIQKEAIHKRISSLEAINNFSPTENESGKNTILDQFGKISPIRDSVLPPAPEPVHNAQNSQVSITKGSSLETMKVLLENFKNKAAAKKVIKSKPIKAVYKGFGNFILNERKFTFSKDFVLGIIINAWRLEVAKSKAAKNQPSQLRTSLNKLKTKK